MEESGCSAESRMGTLHDPSTRCVCAFARMSKTRPNMCHLYCCYCWYSCSWLLFIIEPHILLFRRPLAQSQWLQNHKLKELWKLDTIWRCLRDAGCTPDQLVSISFVLLHVYLLFCGLDYHHCAWTVCNFLLQLYLLFFSSMLWRFCIWASLDDFLHWWIDSERSSSIGNCFKSTHSALLQINTLFFSL